MVPWPGFERAQTYLRAPGDLIHMARPSPCLLRVGLKGSKIFSICCGVMPMPVSINETCQSSARDSTAAVSVPPPS